MEFAPNLNASIDDNPEILGLNEAITREAMRRLVAEEERQLIKICDRNGWPTTPEYIQAHMATQQVPTTEAGEISRTRYRHDDRVFLEVRTISQGSPDKLFCKQEFICT